MRYPYYRNGLNSQPLRFASIVQRFGLLLSLLCLLLTAAYPANATHFRYGSLTWQTSPADPTGRTIIFTVTQAFRENYPWPGGPPSNGSTEYTGDLLFGDTHSAPINLPVTSVDASSNSFFGEVHISHTYSSVGSFTASYTSCCRLSELKNNHDEDWYIKTNVTTGTHNNSPVSTLPAVVNLAVGQPSGPGQPAATFSVPGADSNGDQLTFSLATASDLAPYSFTNAPGLTISPTGIASFNTASSSVGDLYNAIVKISDGTTTIMVDFIIQVVGSSASPVFDYGPTPANGSTIQVVAGHPVAFTVQAHDPNIGDAVNLQGSGIPLGATFATPAAANPVSSAFSWTPTAASVGPHVLSFTAQDQVGVQAITSVTLDVILCNLSLSTSPTSVTCNGGANGAINLTVNGGTGLLTYQWSGPNGFAASTEDLTSLPAGTYSVTVTDANNCSETASATVTEPVPVPVPSITPTATSSVYTGGPVTTIYLGYGPQSVILTASGGDGTYSWSPVDGLSNIDASSVMVSPTATTTYTVTAANAAGCTASASRTINVVDVRCGTKNDKVLVCHNGSPICISPNAVNTHLTSSSHSDVLGACPVGLRAGLNAPLSESVSLEAYPNPATEQATIVFRSVQSANASVEVYNSLGARVAILYNGLAEAGQQYSVVLDSKALANGLYYCRVVANGQIKTMGLMVTK